MTDSAVSTPHDEEVLDFLTIGRRVRQARTDRGMTLDDLGAAIGRAASQVSVIENGKREPKLSELQAIARALSLPLDALLTAEAPSGRAALEIALERAQRGPLYSSLGLPPLPVRKTLSDEAITTVLGLHAELEQTATGLLAAVGHEGGPLSQRVASDLATHLGFTLHYVTDLPASTRSVTDTKNGRIYLPANGQGHDPRSALLQALASFALGEKEPLDYADFLRQRVETNYLAAALLIPEAGAVAFLEAAKAKRELSVEDLRDAFAVSYETAAHRFTNLATEHLGIPLHFLKVHESGTISKAYENDGAAFPRDVLGAIEGQFVCRKWSARQVFDVADRFSPYHQYTDKPSGTYWCTSSIQPTAQGAFSVSVGTPFAHVKWFRGRDTSHRQVSTCPDDACCRRAPADLSAKWATHSRPSARLQSSLLAAMPTGVFPGVDATEVYTFLEAHSPS